MDKPSLIRELLTAISSADPDQLEPPALPFPTEGGTWSSQAMTAAALGSFGNAYPLLPDRAPVESQEPFGKALAMARTAGT